MAKGTKYSQEFKEDAVRYRLEHPEMALRKCAENLGISESALKNWMKSAKNHEGTVPTRGSGNYASDEAKEIAHIMFHFLFFFPMTQAIISIIYSPYLLVLN